MMSTLFLRTGTKPGEVRRGANSGNSRMARIAGWLQFVLLDIPIPRAYLGKRHANDGLMGDMLQLISMLLRWGVPSAL